MCIGEGKGGSGKSRGGKFRVESWVSWVGEGAEKELGRVVGHETSGMCRGVAIRVEIESEGGVRCESVTEGVVVGDGSGEGVKNVLGGKI